MMNPEFPIKECLGGPSFSSSLRQPIQQQHEAAPPPRPMDRLHEMGPPPFLTKTFEMVDNSAIDQIVSWSRGGCSFVVWDPHAFSTSVLPSYFKHNNFSSFVRQLNTYGFRKIDPDKLEFANERFIRGQKHLLKNIRRRKAPSQHLAPESEQAIGSDAEINQLRRDKRVLIMEIVKLRQQQQSIRSYLNQMELKLRGTEKKQKKMMNFLARAMQNPEFIQKLLCQKEKREEVEETSRHPGPSDEPSRINQGLNLVNTQPLEFDNSYSSQLSELEALALEMQGLGKARRKREEHQDEIEQIGSSNKDSGKSF